MPTHRPGVKQVARKIAAGTESEVNPAAFSVDDAVTVLDDVGPKRLELLEALGVRDVRDLLYHFPRTWHDRAQIIPSNKVAPGETATICGEIVSARQIRLGGRQTLAHIIVKDDFGIIGAKFFGRGFLVRTLFIPGARILLSGKVGLFKGNCLDNPEYEVIQSPEDDPVHAGRIIPVYRLTDGLSQRQVRRWVHKALDAALASLSDPLPETTRSRLSLQSIHEAMPAIHYPDNHDATVMAKHRFVMEELLFMQLEMFRRRRQFLAQGGVARHTVNGPCLRALGEMLSFPLTGAQDKVIAEILHDMAGPQPMLRLLQGDVGCGKTLVAMHALAAAADGQYQTAFMAPTEILAEQHALTLRNMLAPLGFEVALVTGNTRETKAVRRRLAEGSITVAVGTHALIQESTVFKRLGLVIIDEQHRFGVAQRALLAAKGPKPDVLQLSATPIPRTLAITLYGDMDVSVIDELPPGRMPVKTRRLSPAKLPDLYRYMREEAEKGFQSYVVCPLIEESTARAQLTSLLRHFDALTSGPLAGVNTGLLHGRMPSEEKELVMRRFKAGEIQVLFSTTVIEVGVDVPQATIMVIEDAGDFGLTQLHQLRGRVGRGTAPSYCFLTGTPRTQEGRLRLEALCRCASGFDLAEEDFKLRGPGDLLGLRQAGLSDLRLADLIRDARLIPVARREAEQIFAEFEGNTLSLTALIDKYFNWRRVHEAANTLVDNHGI